MNIMFEQDEMVSILESQLFGTKVKYMSQNKNDYTVF